jgi:hypothetical protein
VTVPTPADDEEWSELVDFHPDRVDLVKNAANGTRFLIAKQDASAGLLDPEFVRSLISKEAPVPAPAETGETTLGNGIVLKGSPAAMAAFIHAASVRNAEEPVAKEKYSAEDKRKMLAAGHAIKNDNGDPAYMIGDEEDLGKAIHAVGRGGSDHDRIRAYVIRRAKALGKTSMIPDNWNTDGSLKEDVSKSWAAYNAAHPHHGGHPKKLPSKPSASAFQQAQQTLALERAGGKPTAAELKNAHAVHEAHLAHLAHEKAEQEKAEQEKNAEEAKPAPKPAPAKSPVKKNSREAGMPDQVAKDGLDLSAVTPDEDDLDDGMDGLDPTVPFAAPDDLGDLPGDPAEPGSPAWEAVDAATAGKWLGILARAKNAIMLLSDREAVEAATADPDDIASAYGLQDAACALDSVIGQLAVFAAGEQAEADLAAEAMEAVGKAVAGAEGPVSVIEGLTAIAKAGRVLSASNEAAIRAAAESLQKVLASLPEAPVAKEAGMAGNKAAGVAKEASPEEQARSSGPVSAGGTTGLGEPRDTGPAAALPGDGPQAARPGDVPGRTVIKAARLPVLVYDRYGKQVTVRAGDILDPVAKADGDGGEKPQMQAVFDQDGDLIGVVDPAAITPVAGASAPAADDGADETAAAPAADDSDMQPQPPADAGTPSEDVAKTAGDPVSAVTLSQDVLKSVAEQAARTALAAAEAAHQEVVAKMAADNAGLAGQLEAVTKRLETVEAQPAMPKVFTSGQVPPAHQLRGQDQGTAPVDVTKARGLKETLYRGTAPEQKAAFDEMQQMAVDQLAALHSARR